VTITLFTFGPAWGLPDPSPFVTKAHVLLKLAGLVYRTDTSGFRRAPKHKLPYIEDDGRLIADSTFIRWHLEERYRVDFDRGLSPSERAIAWAVEKMLEDHLYWAMLDERWMVDRNFEKGPAVFFRAVPPPFRGLVCGLVRRSVARRLRGHGLGLHSRPEIERLALRAVDSVAAILGDRPYLMGAAPCGADATAFAFIAGLLCPLFESPIRAGAEQHANLVAYADRMMREHFPDFSRR
jgi:glutathione S-transferase